MIKGVEGFGLAIATLMAVAALSHSALAEVTFTVRGDAAFLHSNELAEGDSQRFEEFLAEPRASPIRIIYLDSRGGSTEDAIAIGHAIRARGIATAFHPGRARCVSACTTMFLGGAARYYIGGASVADGAGTDLGLGFHPSDGGAPMERSILTYYRNMGVPSAATWRYMVFSREQAEAQEGRNFRPIFFVGGRSALKSSVATSLQEPADPRLRD